MKANFGALLFGAALLSMFVPKRREREPVHPRPAPEPFRRLYALVQTKPNVVVLALSGRVEELEREIVELNETWNHWALRSERRRFEIQPAPILIASLFGAPHRQRVAAAPRT